MIPTAEASAARTKPCRDCRREVSRDAYACPHCGQHVMRVSELLERLGVF